MQVRLAEVWRNKHFPRALHIIYLFLFFPNEYFCNVIQNLNIGKKSYEGGEINWARCRFEHWSFVQALFLSMSRYFDSFILHFRFLCCKCAKLPVEWIKSERFSTFRIWITSSMVFFLNKYVLSSMWFPSKKVTLNSLFNDNTSFCINSILA